MKKTLKQRKRLHFQSRMKTRFGINLSSKECKDIVDFIQAGKSDCVKIQSNRVSIHAMNINDKLVHVVYDKKRKVVVTALLPEWEV